MATYRRVQVPGTTYFFTLATYRRQPLLSHLQSVAAVRDAIRTVRKVLPFEIVAFVMLPDHLHAIWTLPPGDADYPRRWSLFKRAAGSAIREFVRIERCARRDRGRAVIPVREALATRAAAPGARCPA